MRIDLSFKTIAFVLFGVIFVNLVPVVVYGIHFYVLLKSGLSDDPAHWGVFGDYVGGTLNPILAFLTLSVTLYLAKIAQSLEQKTNQAELRRQNENSRPLAR